MQSLRAIRPSTRNGASTIIAVHASAGSSRQWAALREHLGSGYRLIAPDLHGHGQVPMSPFAPWRAVEADAGIVTGLLDSAPDRVHLVGHSYGGVVALRAAIERPSQVASLTVYEPVLFHLLLDQRADDASAAEIVEMACAVRSDVLTGNLRGAARRFCDYWANESAWAATHPRLQQSLARRMPTVASHFLALLSDAPRLHELARLPIPVQVLVGTETRSPSRLIGERLAASLRRWSMRWLPGLGHMGPLTHPEVVNPLVAQFLEMEQRSEQPLERLAA